MTREEALQMIPNVIYAYNTENFIQGSYAAQQWFDAVEKALKAEPCEDCVSRDAVLEALYDHEYKKDIRKDIEALPSVQPKQTKSCYKMCDRWQRTGKWIAENSVLRCSLCNESVMRYDKYPFCPNCGAKMEVEE